MHHIAFTLFCKRGITSIFLQLIIFCLIIISLLFGFYAQAFEGNNWEKQYWKCVEGNCEDGKGTMVYYSTQKYVGEFKDGRRHGQGTLYLPLHRVLTGTWRDDEIVEGTATFADGTRYTGTWEFGFRHGKGELEYPDGRKYVGYFHAGNKHGKGKMFYPDGRVYTGEFKAGERTGHGTLIYPDGRKKTGRFLNGEYLGADKD
jgi:hypothetical protein